MKFERSTSCEVLANWPDKSANFLHRDLGCRYSVQINEQEKENGIRYPCKRTLSVGNSVTHRKTSSTTGLCEDIHEVPEEEGITFKCEVNHQKRRKKSSSNGFLSDIREFAGNGLRNSNDQSRRKSSPKSSCEYIRDSPKNGMRNLEKRKARKCSSNSFFLDIPKFVETDMGNNDKSRRKSSPNDFYEYIRRSPKNCVHNDEKGRKKYSPSGGWEYTLGSPDNGTAGGTLHSVENVDNDDSVLQQDGEKKSGESKWNIIRRRLSAGSQRPRKNLMSSIFNDDLDANSNNTKAAVSRKAGFQMTVKDESPTLQDILLQSLNNIDIDYENSPDDAYIEESWTEVITEYDGMTGKDRIQQETIWELLITERNYLRKLRVIIMVFKACLVNLQQENHLNCVDLEKLFSNIDEVYVTNQNFWEIYLKKVPEEARQSKLPIRPSQLHDSFSSFGSLFEPYIKYCMEESSCMKYLKQLKRENEVFQDYLVWCENHNQCMRLKLADLFVKPMQRVTKYALLLKAVLKATIDVHERTSLENMILQVDTFVTKINTTLRLRNEQQKLEDVLDRIEMHYHPMDAANEEVERLLSETDYCKFNLNGNVPGLPEEQQRCILLEGAMKMIEKQGRSDVYVFLFTDVLIFAKNKKGSDKLRIIRQPFRLNKIMLHKSKDLGSFIFIYLNEYGILVTAFTLQVAAHEQKKWFTAIEKAKKRYDDARASQGSTLDFFDDDMPFMTPYAFTCPSPMPDRRSLTTTSIDDNRLDASSNKDDLRSRSTETVRGFQKAEERIMDNHVKRSMSESEPHVKRSFSDPKAAASYINRDKKIKKVRPKSLASASDHDIASWVLSNEKRNQSGSIMSDISDDSQRSSGIGDSFRSINSDIGITFNGSISEVSKVAQLKARFEGGNNGGCDSPCNTEGSDDSLCETPPGVAGSRRVSPPDYMDDELTIKEEEEHLTGIDKTAITMPEVDKDIDNDNSTDSARTINDDNSISSTVRSSVVSYENAEFIKIPIQYISTTTQTENIDNNSTYFHETIDTGIQCELLADKTKLDELKRELSGDSRFNKIDICILNDNNENIEKDLFDQLDLPNHNENNEKDLLSSIITQLSTTENENVLLTPSPLTPSIGGTKTFDFKALSADVSTQYDNEFLLLTDSYTTMDDDCILTENLTHAHEEPKTSAEVSTQYECTSYTRNTGTQCGDFIQLAEPDEKSRKERLVKEIAEKTKINDNPPRIRKRSLPLKKSNSLDGSSKSDVPFFDMQTDLNIIHNRVNSMTTSKSLRHSCSEVNISRRSRSDLSNPNSPRTDRTHSSSTSTYESPGMRALQTLSESLESSLQKRIVVSKPIVKNYDEDITKNDGNVSINSNLSPIRAGSVGSPSLRKLALLKNSPMLGRKDLVDPVVNVREDDDGDKFNDNNIILHGPIDRSSPRLRIKSASAILSEPSKRMTWHNFDSMAALDRIEQTKYGPDGKGDRVGSLKQQIDRSLSQSSSSLTHKDSKKSNFKKSIIKKFTDLRSEKSRSQQSSSQDISDEASSRRQKKELKKLKKEKRNKEKEDKKRERGLIKSRSASNSSSNSRSSTTPSVDGRR